MMPVDHCHLGHRVAVPSHREGSWPREAAVAEAEVVEAAGEVAVELRSLAAHCYPWRCRQLGYCRSG